MLQRRVRLQRRVYSVVFGKQLNTQHHKNPTVDTDFNNLIIYIVFYLLEIVIILVVLKELVSKSQFDNAGYDAHTSIQFCSSIFYWKFFS